MHDPVPHDEDLLALAARGDAEALRALYRRHAGTVHGVAAAILGAGPDAEEVTQDVFLRAWEKAGDYDPARARVGTWLARIARNRAIDVLRHGALRAARAPQVPDPELYPDPSAADPAVPVQEEQRRRAVWAAVAALPPEQRRALTLAFRTGLTHRQIAERLGEPLGTVKTRIRDALIRLRGVLGPGGRP